MSVKINEEAIKKLKSKMASKVDYFWEDDNLRLRKLESNIQEFCLFKNRDDWESVKESRIIIENLLNNIYRVYGISISIEEFLIKD